jgi:CRP-like cAMP-binding protein
MTDSQQVVDTLRRASLFEGVSPATIEAIAGACTTREADEGDVVYELGDDARDVYVVQSGRVRFALGVGNRGESRGSIFESGMVLGWAALVDEPRRVATAVCLEPSRLLVLSGQELLRILADHPEDGFVVMRRLAAMIARNFIA